MDKTEGGVSTGGSWGVTRREFFFFLLGLGLTVVYFAALQERSDTSPSIEAIAESVVEEGEGNGIENSKVEEAVNDDSPLEEKKPADTSDLSVLSTHVPGCAKKLGKAEKAFMLMVSHSGTTGLIVEIASHQELGNYTNTLDMEPLVGCHGDLECEMAKTQKVYERAAIDDKVGILKYNGVTMQTDFELWDELFHQTMDSPPHFLLMYRENVFKRAVGRYPYNNLDFQEHFGGLMPGEESRCDSGALCTFPVEPKELVCQMKRAHIINEKMISLAKKISGPEQCYLEIKYEDYLYYPEQTLFMVEDFLGVKRGGTTPGRAKATNDNMCEVIENYAEVCAALNECSLWSPMINDEANNCLCKNYKYKPQGGDGVNPLCSLEKQEWEKWYCVVDLPENLKQKNASKS